VNGPRDGAATRPALASTRPSIACTTTGQESPAVALDFRGVQRPEELAAPAGEDPERGAAGRVTGDHNPWLVLAADGLDLQLAAAPASW